MKELFLFNNRGEFFKRIDFGVHSKIVKLVLVYSDKFPLFASKFCGAGKLFNPQKLLPIGKIYLFSSYGTTCL